MPYVILNAILSILWRDLLVYIEDDCNIIFYGRWIAIFTLKMDILIVAMPFHILVSPTAFAIIFTLNTGLI